MMNDLKSPTGAHRLRAAREKAGFASAAAAARHHQWGEAAYRHHENGTRTFGTDLAVQYARAFKVSAIWLLGLATEKYNARVPLAKFYIQVYAEHLGEGDDIYELINDMFVKLGISMFPELTVTAHDMEWVVGSHGRPPMHFIDPAEVSVDTSAISDGYVFAYRVEQRFPRSRLEQGNVLLIDSSVGEIGRDPSMYLFRDEQGSFVRGAQYILSGEAVLMPDAVGGPMESFEHYEPLALLGKVVWIGQRA